MGRKSKAVLEKERNEVLKNKKTATQDLPCEECGKWMYDVPGDIVSITCGRCVILDVGFPESPQNKKVRPRGWHLRKEFVDKDGTVFHKGVEQPDLKGTIPPTKLKPGPKKKPKKKPTVDDLVEEELQKIEAKKKRKKS